MTAAFDTLKYARRLKEAGVPEAQAEVHAEALHGVLEEQIQVRFDRIDERFDRVDQRFAQVDRELADARADLRLLKWMMSFVLALLVAVLWLLIRA